jgi:hypothetical protein
MGMVSNAVSTLLARTGIATALGIQMGGKRDLYETFGWNKNPDYKDFMLKYRRNAVARRVVNAYPDALWADPPIISADDTFNKAWDALKSGISIFAYLQKLDKLCRQGEFAILVVGLDDGGSLDQPVRKKKNGELTKVLYLQPYSEASVDVDAYEENERDPRYGLPTMYSVEPGNFDDLSKRKLAEKSVGTQKSFKVHWTRVLHVAEGALESPVFGTSCLEPIFNDLEDLEKAGGGSAEIFWLNARQGLHVDVDKDLELKAGDQEALGEEIDEYSNNLRRVIRTRGVKVTNLGSNYLDPTGVLDGILSNIAACTGIPKRVLSGSEAGQLASQQDRANWANRVDERVSEFGAPVVLLPLLRMLIDANVLPQPEKLIVQWPDSFKMNPLERAQTSAQMARSAANLAKTLFTVQQINHANAMDSLPQPVAGGGGGFFGNANDPSKSSKGTVKNPSGAPPDAKGAGDKSGQPNPEPQMQPALFDKKPPTIELLTVEECRQIIGFGKHMPVFDESQNDDKISPNPQGSNPAESLSSTDDE